ncbi:MAG: hypothetical protein KIH44_000420 [Octadecabacter sp.]|nr:hypothetical protein [Octadecabacter sp.]
MSDINAIAKPDRDSASAGIRSHSARMSGAVSRDRHAIGADVETRLWHQAKRPSEVAALELTYALGLDRRSALSTRDAFAQKDFGAVKFHDDVSRIADLSEGHDALGCLIINVDGFDCIEDAVEALMRFRQSRPEVVVIITSGDFLLDDLGTERRTICDASLRVPLTPRRIQIGLRAATHNNSSLG